MNDLILFEREEVQFTHDEEDFVYSFHRFDTGKITFKRLWPAAPLQDAEVIIHPGDKKPLANMAIIVLYKAATLGQQMSGFLPNVLRTMLDMYDSKETLKLQLSRSIASFQARNPIAELDQVVEFLDPYAPWSVSSVQ